MRRALCSLLAIALASVLAAGCGGRSGSSPKLARFQSNAGIAFDYPAGWRLLRAIPGRNVIFTHGPGPETIAFLAAQPLHSPCHIRETPGRNRATICKEPIRKLRPGSVLVSVFGIASPFTTFADLEGRPEKIAGRRAKVEIKRPGRCKSLKGDETFEASIQSGLAYYSFEACFRAPHLGEREREIRALLASIKLTRP